MAISRIKLTRVPNKGGCDLSAQCCLEVVTTKYIYIGIHTLCHHHKGNFMTLKLSIY